MTMTREEARKARDEAREKGLKFYFTGNECKHGHVSNRMVSDGHCVDCTRMRTIKHRIENEERFRETTKAYNERTKEYRAKRDREYREKNIERISERQREYARENRERRSKQQKEYHQREDVKQRMREYNKKYADENRESILKRKREYYKNPLVKASRTLRNFLHRSLKYRDSPIGDSMSALLGYSSKDLVDNLESKFLSGMSWDNYGEWHIDHKYSISYCLENEINDPSEVNRLSNLIPMWSQHNSAKHKKNLDEWLNEKGVDSEEYKLYSRFL